MPVGLLVYAIFFKLLVSMEHIAVKTFEKSLFCLETVSLKLLACCKFNDFDAEIIPCMKCCTMSLS